MAGKINDKINLITEFYYISIYSKRNFKFVDDIAASNYHFNPILLTEPVDDRK